MEDHLHVPKPEAKPDTPKPDVPKNVGNGTTNHTKKKKKKNGTKPGNATKAAKNKTQAATPKNHAEVKQEIANLIFFSQIF